MVRRQIKSFYYFYKLQTANTEKMSRSFQNNTELELEKIYFTILEENTVMIS